MALATVADTIRDLQNRFVDRDIGTPRLDAQLLVGYVLGLDRTQLLANLREPMPIDALSQIDLLAERRLSGEPIAYIVGRKEFLGNDIVVTPAVLTPRPETELLVEWALHWLRHRPEARVVDVGTGSGAIAIGVALGTPETVSITATDVSEHALAVARENAERLCPGRIQFRSGDLLSNSTDQFDLALANLPYLRPDQIEGNFDVVAEPRLALDGGREGLDVIKRLIRQMPAALSEGGATALEIDPSQSLRVTDLLRKALPGARIEVHADLAGLDRFVSALRI
jgi:release factor glutamine methyltransferase